MNIPDVRAQQAIDTIRNGTKSDITNALMDLEDTVTYHGMPSLPLFVTLLGDLSCVIDNEMSAATKRLGE